MYDFSAKKKEKLSKNPSLMNFQIFGLFGHHLNDYNIFNFLYHFRYFSENGPPYCAHHTYSRNDLSNFSVNNVKEKP